MLLSGGEPRCDRKPAGVLLPRQLVNEIYRELRQLQAEVPEDVTVLADLGQGRAGTASPAPRPFPEAVAIRLLGRG